MPKQKTAGKTISITSKESKEIILKLFREHYFYRVEQAPLPLEQLKGYLAGMGDAYGVLTGEKFEFDEEIMHTVRESTNLLLAENVLQTYYEDAAKKKKPVKKKVVKKKVVKKVVKKKAPAKKKVARKKK